MTTELVTFVEQGDKTAERPVQVSVLTAEERLAWDDQRVAREQARLTEAFLHARRLGLELLRTFDSIDEARRQLEDQGLVIAVEFTKPIQEALAAHRSKQRPLELPAWLTREAN